jgi:hypothetical protein
MMLELAKKTDCRSMWVKSDAGADEEDGKFGGFYDKGYARAVEEDSELYLLCIF